MVTIVLCRQEGDYHQDYKPYPEPFVESTPWELFLLTMQHQNIAGEDPYVKQDNHRGCEQREIEYVACGRNNGGQNYDDQDGVPAVPDQERGAGYVDQREQEKNDRNLEDDADSQHHVDKQIVVLRHADRRIHALTDPEPEQKFEPVAESDEIGETTTHN